MSIEIKPTPELASDLPEMLRKIEANWPILPSGIWNNSSIQLLSRHLFECSRRCKDLGEEKLLTLVSAMDEIINRVIDENTPPDERQMQNLERYLEELRAVIGEAHSPSHATPPTAISASTGAPIDLVYLPPPDEELGTLVDLLEARDVQYRLVTDPHALPAILADPGSKTLLLDAAYLGTQALEPVLHLLKVDHSSAPALFIIADQGTIEMRLLALRVGAAHLYSKPVDPQLMLDDLESFIHPHPEPRRRILIVEDDATQATFTAKLLQKGGKDTLAITDPLGVMDAVARFQPDLILMDLYMPGADGIELTRLIRDRRDFSSIPIIFLSGEDDPDKRLLTLHAGADDFLTKPVRPHQLIATVNTRIERVRHIAAAARREVGESTRLATRRELLWRLDLALAGGDNPQSYGALCVIALGEKPTPHELESDNKEKDLLLTATKVLAPLLKPEDISAALGDRQLGLLLQRDAQVDTEHLAEQIYGTLSQKMAGQDGKHIGIGMILLEGAERHAYEQLARTEASAESAYRQDLHGYQPHGETPPVTEPAGDELSNQREAIQQTLKQDSLVFQRSPYTGQTEDAQKTFELIPAPFPTTTGEDPYEVANRYGLAGDFDRLVFRQALQELGDQIMQGHMGRLIFRQSATVLKDPDYLEFIKTELRQRQLVGTGLMVEFDLPSLGEDFMGAKALIGELARLGFEVVLGNFACNAASYKVLTYLMADAVRPHRSLLRIDADKIRLVALQLRSLRAEIILPRVNRQDQIASPWPELADTIQADFGT